MSNLVKKIVATATALTCAVMMLAPVGVQALTAEELQEQITLLMAQLTELQDQLAVLEGEEPEVAEVTIEGVPADFTFETNLSQGMSGDECKYLQIVLNSDVDTQLGETGVGSAGYETTYFGPLTKGAVVLFQEKYTEDVLAYWNLTSGTGYVGSTTRAKLNELLAAVVIPVIPVTPAGCECTVWVDDVCGGGDCSADEMQQTRTCTPEEGAEEDVCEGTVVSQCVADSSCVVAEDITISLAADTPGTSQVAKNAQDVIFTKVKFTGGTSGVTVSKVIVARGGVSADADVASIKLYDGATRLGSTQALNTLTHKATFSSLSWEIPAGETKYLTIKGSIATSPTVGDSVRLGIALATDVTADQVLTGVYPIWGKSKTIAGISVGGLDVTKQTSPAEATILSGAVDQDIAAWKFYASTTEGFSISQIIVTHVGSATVNDVKNIKLKVSGVQIGETIETLDSQNKAVFDLSSPLVLNAATSKIVHAHCDVAGGIWTSRTIKFEITQYTDVTAYGANSGGATVITTDPFATYTKQTGNLMTIGQGSLTVAVDAALNPAAQTYVKGTTERDFVAYKFTTGSREGVRVTKLRFKLESADGAITGSATDISNITLWDGTTQVGGTASVIGSYVTFGANTVGYDVSGLFDVEKSTNKTIVLKADIPSGATSDHTLALELDTYTDIWIDGLSSEYDIDQTATNIVLTGTGKRHTVSGSGSLAVSLSANTPPAQTYVIGSTEKEFTRINLTAGSGEDILVTAITLDILSNTNIASTGAHLINVKLVNAADGVQFGSTVPNPSATADFTGNITVPASGTVSLKAIANVPTTNYPVPNSSIEIASGATGGTVIADAIESTGVYSSATITETGSADGKNITISAGGLTVAAAASPADQTLIKGASEVPFVGLVMTADTAEDVRVTYIKLTVNTEGAAGLASTTDISNIGLYDGDTRLTVKKNLTVSAETTYPGSVHHTVAYTASDFLNSQGITVTKGQQKTITVKADLPSTAGTDHIVVLGVSSTDHFVCSGLSSNTEISETLTKSPDSTHSTGVNIDSDTVPTDAYVHAVTIKAAGSLSMVNNPNKPVTAIHAVGSEGSTLADIAFHKVDFTAAMEDIYVKSISVERSGGSDADFGAISIWDGSTQLGSDQTFVGATTTFSFPESSYWTLSKGVKKTLTIKADLKGVKTSIGYGSDSGDAPLIRLDRVTVQGVSSGSVTPNGYDTYDLEGNVQYLRQSKPTLAAASLPSTVLTAGGGKVLYRWTVTADSKGDIGWKMVGFNITGMLGSKSIKASTTAPYTNGTTDGVYIDETSAMTKMINNFKVWNLTDNVHVTATATDYDGTSVSSTCGAILRADADAGTGYNIIFVAGTEQVIASGATRSYELRADILTNKALAVGDTISTKIDNLTTATAYATTSDYLSVSRNPVSFVSEYEIWMDNYATSSISFIWTDRSSTDTNGVINHTRNTSDWTNDLKVSGLPASVLSMTK